MTPSGESPTGTRRHGESRAPPGLRLRDFVRTQRTSGTRFPRVAPYQEFWPEDKEAQG
jgi:hypothetical protein